MAAAKAWYDSPEYQDAKQHRLRGADFRIILTEASKGARMVRPAAHGAGRTLAVYGGVTAAT
jgi:Domain of unknown function (DUF1330)